MRRGMRRAIATAVVGSICLLIVGGCAGKGTSTGVGTLGPHEAADQALVEGPVSDDREAEGETEVPEDVEEEGVTKVAITAGGVTLEAEFGDNACARALINQMPFTVPMEDLYGRELCYRYGAGALPTEGLRYDGYELGDICYWPPRGSLVILYAQNGEEFERQQVGRVTSDISVLNGLGDVDVTFSLA